MASKEDQLKKKIKLLEAKFSERHDVIRQERAIDLELGEAATKYFNAVGNVLARLRDELSRLQAAKR